MTAEKSVEKKHEAFGFRALLAVAMPLAATVGCFSITLFTDRTLLMWYGPTSSAASVSAGNLYWAVVCIPVTAMGFITPLVAMTLGRSRRRGAVTRRAWSLVWQCIWLTLACVPLLVLVGWLSPRIFEAFGHEPNLAGEEARYFRTLLLVAPASMLEAGLTAFFIGRRITRPILRTNIASAVVNVILDVWLIFGGLGLPAMGVLGAALATAIAMWMKACVFAVLLFRVRSFGRHFAEAWRPNLDVIREIVLPGSALGVQQLIRSSLFSFVLLVIGAASVTGLAATSAALSLYQLLSIPAIGLATAVTVVTGQGFAAGGSGLAGMAVRRGLVIGAVGVVLMSVLLVGFPHQLLRIPLGGLEAAQRVVIEPIAVTLLGYAAVYGFVDVASLLMGAAVKGIGKTSIILVATAVPGVLSVTLGYALAPDGEAAVTHWWTVLVVWAAAQSAIVGGGVVQLFGFRSVVAANRGRTVDDRDQEQPPPHAVRRDRIEVR
ncbi:MATE family efflux transporter [Aporhodopirellula aestuarii]|uniref:MATE family efflux transporter n=1 Tax=Aporhodopirellula aestuarii TaxID=2950107 RepID=A0ABT0U9Q2_9BACT|nr:MATE family efflux transporter [Aporhodopirellula aestuarii]MCM2373672.1 MATE family efflux transporter [Aporhodopirellula aestuarii]